MSDKKDKILDRADRLVDREVAKLEFAIERGQKDIKEKTARINFRTGQITMLANANEQEKKEIRQILENLTQLQKQIQELDVTLREDIAEIKE